MLSNLHIKKAKNPKLQIHKIHYTETSENFLKTKKKKKKKEKSWKQWERYGILAIRKKTIQNSHHKPLSQRKWHNRKPGHYIWNKHMNSLKGGEENADGLESSWSIKWYSHFGKQFGSFFKN